MISLLAVILGSASLTFAQDKCGALATSDLGKVESYLMRRYKLSPTVKPQTTVLWTTPDCFRRLLVRMHGSNQALSLEVYLSPDRRFLTTDYYDLESDAAAQDRANDAARSAALDSGDRPVLGNAAAKLRIVVFYDDQCPACAALWPALEQVTRKYGSQAALKLRFFPLQSIHPWALDAATLGYCTWIRAGADAFWQLHEFFRTEQSQFSVDNVRHLATERLRLISPDTLSAIGGCLEDRTARNEVFSDMELGARFRVNSVPAIFVNGHRVSSNTETEIVTYLEDALRAGKAMPANP